MCHFLTNYIYQHFRMQTRILKYPHQKESDNIISQEVKPGNLKMSLQGLIKSENIDTNHSGQRQKKGERL